MRPKVPELLLLFYLFLPKWGIGAMAAQVILSQIKAIYAAQQAEKQLSLDLDNDNAVSFQDFLLALWFDPSNTVAYGYFGLFTAPQNGEITANGSTPDQ